MVGDDQIAAPAGPQSCVPAGGLLRRPRLGRESRSSSRSPCRWRRRAPRRCRETGSIHTSAFPRRLLRRTRPAHTVVTRTERALRSRAQPDDRRPAPARASRRLPHRARRHCAARSPKNTAGRDAPSAAHPSDGDRRADAGRRHERPVRTTGRRVERVDHTLLTADEHATGGDGRLCERLRRVREAERPFQLQPRNVIRRDTGVLL